MDRIKEEIEKIKKQIEEIETRFAITSEYELITYILDKVCNIDEIEIKKEDIENEKNKTMYIINKNENGYRLKRLKEGE